MIHTVKGFSLVNEAEVDVFLEFLAFSMIQRNVGNLISGSSLAQLITRRIYIRFQHVPGNHVMYHTMDVWVGKEGWIASVKAALPLHKHTHRYMHTWASHCSQTQPSNTEPLRQKDRKGNSFPLWELHFTLWPACPKNRAGSAVQVRLCKQGPQEPGLTHPWEQVGAFVSQLKGLPPCLHPTCLSPSVHPSTSGGFLGSPGHPICLLGRACRAMMQGPMKARPCVAFRAFRKALGFQCVFYWMTGHF